ncbi:MAG: MBL fold metallo-hydrolase [Leptospiraceae bacterium]|nr:MBL fold metallo-hydrolase [Leptospiraceae bacterium]
MKVRLWGVRGSLPTPMNRSEYHEKLIHAMEYAQQVWQADADCGVDEIINQMHPNHKSVIGGETTCLEINHDDTVLVFDLGTGARNLGASLMQRQFRGDLHVFLTHTHWDHIQGFPFFIPAYIPDNTIHFYSCLDNLKERFSRQQHPDHFPRRFDDMPAQTEFHYAQPGDCFTINGLKVCTCSLIHPGGSIAYRIEAGSKTVIFATDTEFYGPELSRQMSDYQDFFAGADLLLMDAQYSLQEAEEKKGWGHTAMTLAVDCAIYWGIKRLILTHHEPAHQDKEIWRLFEEAVAYIEARRVSGMPFALDIFTAKEGDEYEI